MKGVKQLVAINLKVEQKTIITWTISFIDTPSTYQSLKSAVIIIVHMDLGAIFNTKWSTA